MKRYSAMIAALALCCTLVPVQQPAIALPRIARATVTIEGVHYTFPLPAGANDRELPPRNPLCYVYEYFYMTIVDRELYINGELRYRANPGDDVVVVYPQGVRVNGAPAPPQPAKRLATRPCVWSDFPP
jgi:hypothetical protein